MQSFFINQCQCMLLPVYERCLAGRNSQPCYQSDNRNIYTYFTSRLKKYQTLNLEIWQKIMRMHIGLQTCHFLGCVKIFSLLFPSSILFFCALKMHAICQNHFGRIVTMGERKKKERRRKKEKTRR